MWCKYFLGKPVIAAKLAPSAWRLKLFDLSLQIPPCRGVPYIVHDSRVVDAGSRQEVIQHADAARAIIGPIAISDSLAGWLACGFIMLFCFVLMPGTGGGDVKLLAMIGAGLGLEDGLTALLWTCTLGAISSLAVVIWQVGAWTILKGAVHRAALLIRAKGWVPWTTEQKQVLNQRFRLGPCALLAVLITRAGTLYGGL